MFAQLPVPNPGSETVAEIPVARRCCIQASPVGILASHSALCDDLENQVLCRDLLLILQFIIILRCHHGISQPLKFPDLGMRCWKSCLNMPGVNES